MWCERDRSQLTRTFYSYEGKYLDLFRNTLLVKGNHLNEELVFRSHPL